MTELSFRSVFEVALPLFLIMDPLGNAALCISMLKGTPSKAMRSILFRELCIALGIIFLFYYVGDAMLAMLDIHPSTLRLAGGTILFMISIKMIFPREEGVVEKTQDPFIVPIAIPLIAGPSLLAAVMLYAHKAEAPFPGSPVVLLGILSAWAATAVIMLLTPEMTRVLGKRGMRAAERLMGLILVLLAVQMLENGLMLLVQSLRNSL
ncbi:MarC family protein [Oleidesulfovibrio sp.]|uniref:MarC family protein n=1 Tax=Oleidesulfovibrio sp. TaxID=2909707 RepID=UPI003A8B2EA6